MESSSDPCFDSMSSMFFQNPWMKEKTYFFNKSISTEIDLNEKPYVVYFWYS